MKTWILSILVFFVGLSTSIGQNEIPLLQPEYTWDIYNWRQGAITFYTSGSRQFIDGDTIIDGKEYQIIRGRRFRSVSQPVFVAPFELEELVYIRGFIREDLPAQKVYSRGKNADDVEYLTYDFSLEIGDTLVLEYLDQTKAVLDTIEEVTLFDGQKRRQFRFQNNNYLAENNNTYIEGIGGASSLFLPFDANFERGSDLGCVRSGNTSLYGIECLSVVNTEELEILNSVGVYPNPTTDQIFIDLGGFKKCSIQLSGINGTVVFQQDFNSDQISLSLKGIPSGLYFLQMETEEGWQQTKIVKR